MPAELEPPELARLIAFADRPRAADWSLRSALCRYAQPQPRRVSQVLELVRRIDFALPSMTPRLAAEGPALWAALEVDASGDPLVGVLGEVRRLDELADVLADWAEDRAGKHPEDLVDATTTEVARRLDELGVPREERERPPPGARSRG